MIAAGLARVCVLILIEIAGVLLPAAKAGEADKSRTQQIEMVEVDKDGNPTDVPMGLNHSLPSPVIQTNGFSVSALIER